MWSIPLSNGFPSFKRSSPNYYLLLREGHPAVLTMERVRRASELAVPGWTNLFPGAEGDKGHWAWELEVWDGETKTIKGSYHRFNVGSVYKYHFSISADGRMHSRSAWLNGAAKAAQG